MTKIKICGLTREDDALFCADQGADFLGFIFVPSTPRFIEPERAVTIAAKVRERDASIVMGGGQVEVGRLVADGERTDLRFRHVA